MPIFFFDFTLDGVIETDAIGTEFPSLEMAYLDVCRAALDMSCEKLRVRGDPHLDSIEILDADHRSLMQVPFSDVLRPKPSLCPATQPRWSQTINSCRSELARSKRLHAEIGGQLKEIESTSSAIRASLERFKEAPYRGR